MKRKLLAVRLAAGLVFSPMALAAAPAAYDAVGPSVQELALRSVGPSVKAPDRDAALKSLRDGVPWNEVVESLGLEEWGRSLDAAYRYVRRFKVPLPRILPGTEVTLDAAGRKVDCRLLRVQAGKGPRPFLLEAGGQYFLEENAPRLDLSLRRRGGSGSLRMESIPGRPGVSASAAWLVRQASLRVGAEALGAGGDGRQWTAGVGFPVGARQRVEYSYGGQRHQATWTHTF